MVTMTHVHFRKSGGSLWFVSDLFYRFHMAFCVVEGLASLMSMFIRIFPFCFFSVMTKLEIQGQWLLGPTSSILFSSLRLCRWALIFLVD